MFAIASQKAANADVVHRVYARSMSLILQAFHEYYTAFFKEYQATEILEKSTAEQIRIAAPVKAYLNEIWSYITNAERPTADNPNCKIPDGV